MDTRCYARSGCYIPPSPQSMCNGWTKVLSVLFYISSKLPLEQERWKPLSQFQIFFFQPFSGLCLIYPYFHHSLYINFYFYFHFLLITTTSLGFRPVRSNSILHLWYSCNLALPPATIFFPPLSSWCISVLHHKMQFLLIFLSHLLFQPIFFELIEL